MERYWTPKRLSILAEASDQHYVDDPCDADPQERVEAVVEVEETTEEGIPAVHSCHEDVDKDNEDVDVDDLDVEVLREHTTADEPPLQHAKFATRVDIQNHDVQCDDSSATIDCATSAPVRIT